MGSFFTPHHYQLTQMISNAIDVFTQCRDSLGLSLIIQWHVWYTIWLTSLWEFFKIFVRNSKNDSGVDIAQKVYWHDLELISPLWGKQTCCANLPQVNKISQRMNTWLTANFRSQQLSITYFPWLNDRSNYTIKLKALELNLLIKS